MATGPKCWSNCCLLTRSGCPLPPGIFASWSVQLRFRFRGAPSRYRKLPEWLASSHGSGAPHRLRKNLPVPGTIPVPDHPPGSGKYTSAGGILPVPENHPAAEKSPRAVAIPAPVLPPGSGTHSRAGKSCRCRITSLRRFPAVPPGIRLAAAPGRPRRSAVPAA